MSLRAPRLLPRDHGWIETNRGLERGHRLITYTMRPDRQIPAHAALWEIRGVPVIRELLRHLSAFPFDPAARQPRQPRTGGLVGVLWIPRVG